MGHHPFLNLCTSLCRVAGVDASELVQGRNGSASASMQVDGVKVTLAHVPAQAPGGVLVMVELGAIPCDRELPIMLALLDANFLMPPENSASIGRCPVGGEAILQSCWLLDNIDGPSAHAKLIQMTQFVRKWQRDHFLDAAGQPAVQIACVA